MSVPTDDAIARLLPPRRPALEHRSHLAGSGANPGIVNALTFTALEEVATLARRLSSVEIGFIYRIPPAARGALAANPDRASPEQWHTRRLYPPWIRNLAGRDRVGVLLCSRRFGELWMGFDTDMALGLGMGTNATQLQVAAGVLAGWSQLGSQKGIHFVEDLDCRHFVTTASEVLGPPVIVHDARAARRTLADRSSMSQQTASPQDNGKHRAARHGA